MAEGKYHVCRAQFLTGISAPAVSKPDFGCCGKEVAAAGVAEVSVGASLGGASVALTSGYGAESEPEDSTFVSVAAMASWN